MTSGVGVGDGAGLGAAFFTATPLLHNSFLPDLMQVNFIPFTVDVIPAFLQTLPCLATALAEMDVTSDAAITSTQILMTVRIPKGRGRRWSDSMTNHEIIRVISELRKFALCSINQGIAGITKTSKSWISCLPCNITCPNLLNNHS